MSDRRDIPEHPTAMYPEIGTNAQLVQPKVVELDAPATGLEVGQYEYKGGEVYPDPPPWETS